MNNIKQSPFLGLTGMGGGGTGLALGGAAGPKIYVDEVFNLDAWVGTNTDKTITNGIDLSGEGGLVWIKSRSSSSSSFHWALADTERGTNKILQTNAADESKSIWETLKAWYSTGFKLGGAASVNWNTVGGTGDSYIGYTLRKSKGFFDCIKFTGTGASSGSPHTINHSLKSIPGMIICKQINDNGPNWFVYHKSLGEDNFMILNNANTPGGYNGGFKNITSSSFDVFDSNDTNTKDFIAYVFAGGESKATNARSVDFDGSGDYLSFAEYPTDLNLTGDFTIEFWVYPRDQSISRQTIIQTGSWGSQYAVVQVTNDTQSATLLRKAQIWDYDMNQSMPIIYSNADIEENQWTHVAFTRSSGTVKVWINGNLDKTATGLNDSIDLGHTTALIGNHSNSYYLDAKLSNFRIVKGTAVYTTSFRPPTEPLTNISGTELLMCNGVGVTASTVTPGTITSHGNPTSSADSPFDDPDGFVYGDKGEPIIKCGTYKTNSNEDATVDVGFEPQWILTKRTDASGDWRIYDSLRGLSNAQDVESNDGDSKILEVNDTASESTSSKIGLTATGFYADQDGANREYLYMCIRRPDGYVGKIPENATDVFNMDAGNGSSTIPAYNSGFPVDFGLDRVKASTGSWYTAARLIGKHWLATNSTGTETTGNSYVYDSTDGYVAGSWADSSYQSWMWKRYAGMDVITYLSDGIAGRQLRHNLNRIPEMLWIKDREHVRAWAVYHHGANGGTNPEDYWFSLDTNDAEDNNTNIWQSTPPTATHITLGSSHPVNTNLIHNMICFAFASIKGISKVGYYTGDGASTQTITTGFQPRFIIIRRNSSGGNWHVFDTVRGWSAGNDNQMALNNQAADNNSYNYIGAPTSTGFSVSEPGGEMNMNGTKYIYYAHA
tara:strand:- start:1581 stop:4256 length:2676 start_codon:yes stop_codon:yes gene_type:complete